MRARLWGGFLLCAVMAAGCGITRYDAALYAPEHPPPLGEAAFLKAHLHSGEMVAFSSWVTPAEGDSILSGFGSRYSVSRDLLNSGDITIPMDSVALLEANRKETVSRFAFSGLTVWTTLSTLVTIACVADPKSCFGSCPTFYTEGEGEPVLVAEGFSSAVARAFEETDVDALPSLSARERGEFTLLMRNEAPETHAVRWLKVLAVPEPEGGAVFATADAGFLEGFDPLPPGSCVAGEGTAAVEDCTAELLGSDGFEYLSPVDSTDLGARERLEVVFPAAPRGTSVGLLIHGRASLLSTFLFYQSIAYVGSEAGYWLAEVERGADGLAEGVMGLPRALGRVDVSVERGGAWVPAGSFGEAGPIAADQQVIPVGPHDGGPLRIRLEMAKGAWKLDRVALLRLGREVEPMVLSPTSVETLHGGTPSPRALARLNDPSRHLVTQRGEAYEVRFRVPPGEEDLSLFLESRGYYYEWMRGEWAGEEDPVMAALIFSDPQAALRRMAPAYKAREGEMEETFWSSRFRRNDP